MGTCSYVLTGTDKGMVETFGSTCHGAGRALSRNRSRNNLQYQVPLSLSSWRCCRDAAAMRLPCCCHASAMRLPCCREALATILNRGCDSAAMLLRSCCDAVLPRF